MNSGSIGFVTRWSCDGPEPPPLRPLVKRAPPAGVQALDQRFFIPALVGVAGFSGGFLGALSMLRRARHGSLAQRARPLNCPFAAGSLLELLAHRAAQGMHTRRTTHGCLCGARLVLEPGRDEAGS